MAEHILVITDAGGIPLMIRSKPGCKALPFPVVGSLNGLHMFGLNRNVQISTTTTKNNRKIAWKRFTEGNIVIIAISSQKQKNQKATIITDAYFLQLLDNVFDSIVLLTGLTDLENGDKSPDILKRNLRCCYNLVDTFLSEDHTDRFYGSKLQPIDVCMKTPETTILQEHLEAFCSGANSEYGCLLRYHDDHDNKSRDRISSSRVVCATADWWRLGADHHALMRLTSGRETASADIPLFLPRSNPRQALRLLTFELHRGMRAAMLCGPLPTLAYIQHNLVDRYWQGATKSLVGFHSNSQVDNHHLNLTTSSRVVAFAYVITPTSSSSPSQPRQVTWSVRGDGEDGDELSRRLLNYRKSVMELVGVVSDDGAQVITTPKRSCGDEEEDDEEERGKSKEQMLRKEQIDGVANQHYRVTKQFSYYWIKCRGKEFDDEIFAMFPNTVPHFSLQPFTFRLLQALRRHHAD